MRKLLQLGLLLVLGNGLIGCNGNAPIKTPQAPTTLAKSMPVGGGCDGCELMYDGMPQGLDATDTSVGWTEKGQKLVVTGTVYRLDGKIPAPNVVIYYWHTDSEGFYSPGSTAAAKANRHGHLRGWVKTDQSGHYAICTSKPAPYPNEQIPAHIHIAIKEPRLGNEYYTDDLTFDDDPLLSRKKERRLKTGAGAAS